MGVLISALPLIGSVLSTDLFLVTRPGSNDYKATTVQVAAAMGGGGGSGTVTSVATDSTLTGGAITTSGTLGLNLSHANSWAATQTFQASGIILTGSGGNSTTFASLAGSSGKIITFPNLTGTVITTADAGTVTNTMLAGSITASKLVGSDIATVGTITSGTWTGTTIAIAKGGTGQTTSANAINALLPAQTSNSGKFLTTDGSVASWATVSGSGTVTSVATNSTLTGGAITTTGTLGINLSNANTWTSKQSFGLGYFLPTETLASSSSLKWDGVLVDLCTLTLSGSTNITTSGGLNLVTIQVSTISSGSAITVTNSASLAIIGPPDNAGSVTITNSYSLWVQAGKTRLDSTLQYNVSPSNGFILSSDASGNASWISPSSIGLPSQTGNSGLYLTTNGTTASWGLISSSAVSSIGNSDGSISFSSSVGPVTASLSMSQVNAWTGQQYFTEASLTDASTITWNMNTQQSASVLLTSAVGATRALGAPSNLHAGATYTLRIKQSSTGSNALTYNSVFKWAGGVAPVLSTANNAIDVLTFLSDGTNLYGSIQKSFS